VYPHPLELGTGALYNEVRLVGTHLDREIINACRKTNQHPKFEKAFLEGMKYYQIEEVGEDITFTYEV